MTRVLRDGSEAIADAAILAGMRFYSAYPMAPSTDLLEAFSKKLPQAGGVCLPAASEIEGVNMALGACMTGFRAASGSCGQGISLMQEAIAECALHQTPLVIFNVSRGQQDYLQSTRGGGWGDARNIVLCPKDVPEAFELTQLLFHLADQWRMPAILLTDGMLVRTQVGIELKSLELPALPPKDWAFDGKTSGTGKAKLYWTWEVGKHNTPGPGPDRHWNQLAEKFARAEAAEQRHEEGFIDDAEVVVVAFGTAAKFVEHVVRDLRAEGKRVGFFRPISLWPFPGAAMERATRNARCVAVMELNAGQMIQDVRLHATDRSKVRGIGGISADQSGLNFGAMMDAPEIRKRIEAVFEGAPA